MNVLIVGAGPAGMSCALALAQRGIKARVVEIKSDRATIGSELWLSSAFLRTLDALKVADECVAAGVAVNSPGRFFTANGDLIAEIPQPRLTRDSLPLGAGIGRRALHDVLYDKCIAHGVSIQHGMKLTGIQNEGSGARAVFADGSAESYDLIVGADGVNSAVRALAFRQAPKPTFVGQYVWRVGVPFRGSPRLHLYAAPYESAGFITVSESLAYIFCLVKADQENRIEEKDYVVEARKILSKYGGSIAESLASITETSQINYAPLRPVIVKPTWYSHGVLIIGDAAHAVTPHLAHGAGLAVEDGVVLAEELHRNRNVDSAADAFMARRFERCAFAVETTIQISKLQQASPFPSPEQAAITKKGIERLAEPI